MQFLFYSDDCFKLRYVMMKGVWQNKKNLKGQPDVDIQDIGSRSSSR